MPERFPPGGLVRIPVVLQPSTAGIEAPWCRMDLFGSITCVPVWWTKKPYCQSQQPIGDGTSYSWKSCSCADLPGIYYRDAWIQQKLTKTACVFLGGVSASNNGGLWLTNPNPPSTDSAFLPPLLPATWDGGVFISPLCP